MTTRIKVLFSFLIGILTMGFFSTAYFSAFIIHRMKMLKKSLKDYNY
jgi:hypothetical protein